MTGHPKTFKGIMLSSTFTDLEQHRLKAKQAIEKLGFHAVGMESGGAQVVDVIDASLRYVHRSSAYVGIITKKYGQTPVDLDRNPEERSITELEFNEAMRLNLPILLFIMADDHKVLEQDIELDSDRRAKLAAFKARAKLMRTDGKVERVWEPFNSLEDFAERVGPAIGNLARELESPDQDTAVALSPAARELPRPSAPALRALPPYIGSHDFVGRSAELGVLDDWASPADPHPVLVFEALGGNGKSMLTWHWVSQRVPSGRAEWAGRFWYSFYEQGATLAGFCREALSYMGGVPVREFAGMRTPELADRLLAEIDRERWLLVLDGLERILVGYQRSDAAQLRDEDVESIRDPMADRDPCIAIRPEDDELLRRLAAVTSSKLLISTRLTPATLVNNSGQAISGVKRELLKGLRPADAEALFRACGVRGDAQAIQSFLQANCDGHPLVVGVLAGLVNDYLPDRGNFMAWRDDPAYGSKLDWATLDLIQRRNHILDEAIAALDPLALQLLQGLAILIGGADYSLLEAINPHIPPEPQKISEPENPENTYVWEYLSPDERVTRQGSYAKARDEYRRYGDALAAWQADPRVKAAPRRLAETVRNLEKRGLLQYDPAGHRYDLHPVVRGVASGRMSGEELASSGKRVVDYCRAASPKNWDKATSLEDVALGRQLTVTLTRMGRIVEALSVLQGSLSTTLRYQLEAAAELGELLKDFFPDGWDQPPSLADLASRSWLVTEAAGFLNPIDPALAHTLVEKSMEMVIATEPLHFRLPVDILNIAQFSGLATHSRLCELALALAHAQLSDPHIFLAMAHKFYCLSRIGRKEQAEAIWSDLCKLEKPDIVGLYRPGDAEYRYAWHRFRMGDLSEEVLGEAERAAVDGRNRIVIRDLHALRGAWLLERHEDAAAKASLQRAIAMARSVGKKDVGDEAALALARLRTGDRDGARAEIEALDRNEESTLYIASVWAELGERERAIEAARRTHAWAVDDGEPYVHRWSLTRARELLAKLGVELPVVPAHDPASLPKFDWEPKVQVVIDRLNAQVEEAEAAKGKAGEDEKED